MQNASTSTSTNWAYSQLINAWETHWHVRNHMLSWSMHEERTNMCATTCVPESYACILPPHVNMMSCNGALRTLHSQSNHNSEATVQAWEYALLYITVQQSCFSFIQINVNQTEAGRENSLVLFSSWDLSLSLSSSIQGIWQRYCSVLKVYYCKIHVYWYQGPISWHCLPWNSALISCQGP